MAPLIPAAVLASVLAVTVAGCADESHPCVTLTAYVPGATSGERMLAMPVANADATFALAYTHSVTRSPIIETYRATSDGLVQTAIRFDEHGPGLPATATGNEQWRTRDGHFEVTMARPLESVVIRVHGDQSPRLVVDGRTIDVAQWGNRPLVLDARPAAQCRAAIAAPPPPT